MVKAKPQSAGAFRVPDPPLRRRGASLFSSGLRQVRFEPAVTLLLLAGERLQPLSQPFELLPPKAVDAAVGDRVYLHEAGLAQHPQVL